MKKQHNNKQQNHSADPTCGNCMHNHNGHRCCIFPDWPITPEDPAYHCEYHFHRVPVKYIKYYKHKPLSPRGWLWDDQIFAKMLLDISAHIEDIKKGIVSDNNGGYFTRWPFGEKITCVCST